jgi:hypothetical protein
MKKFLSVLTVGAVAAALVATFLGCSVVSGGGKSGAQTLFPEVGYNLTPFVTAPVEEEEPSTTSPSTSEYYNVDSIVWYQGDTEFAETAFGNNEVYKAKLRLSAKAGYSFDGIEADSFYYTGADSVANDAGSGIVTIVFPATATATVSAPAQVDPERPDGDTPTSSLNLMIVFQVEGTDSAAVSETFKRVSAFVQTAQTKTAISEGIHLGDYIDLPSLKVTGYDGTTATTNNTNEDYGYIDETNADWDDARGAKLRIIVVGINSFSTTYSTNTAYAVSDNNNVPHVVFQFQNLPVRRMMNTINTNAGGYAASPMRKYLMPIDGVSGNFYNGLVEAGVPEAVLWGPKRSIAINYSDTATASCNIIEDVLWLPTAWEMFGSQSHSALSEKAANQARLEYYANDGKRTKYNMSGPTGGWWTASPYSGASDAFCGAHGNGTASYGYPSWVGGVAPAFCVK